MDENKNFIEEPIKSIYVSTLFRDQKENLKLELIAGEEGLKLRKLVTPDINRPGLALAGFTQEFPKERIQILGSTEISYLKTLSATQRKNAINNVVSFTPPCLIIANELTPPEGLVALANKYKVPVFKSALETTQLIHMLTTYLDYKLAPETYLHGDLVDVYGVGLLLVGESGIGKSECALDLVERGHRLVADDLIKVLKRSEVVIIGFSAAKSPKLKHHIEIRGVGIVDIYALYGIRAIRMQKRIEVQVELVRYTKDLDYERVGIEDKYTEILGVKIPLVQIPVIPGKNLALVCEVIAKNYLLKILGYSPAKSFNEELVRLMTQKNIEEAKIDPWIDYDIE
ncbi:MAG: HPr(Ser) kinase/phosphatase [candidate division WOR-3 bacterium]|nr:HPr(Ser) kinase/phosphatase [candidate division WOR-3 bacterium]MCX7757539.1 HPr(Ser) kinase/phosphatase [candidate division WOR-3 bacterium]MDW7987638.1 HPr(Ser) kinase/phosphatase [candidate division WOR-3 bacterium]